MRSISSDSGDKKVVDEACNDHCYRHDRCEVGDQESARCSDSSDNENKNKPESQYGSKHSLHALLGFCHFINSNSKQTEITGYAKETDQFIHKGVLSISFCFEVMGDDLDNNHAQNRIEHLGQYLGNCIGSDLLWLFHT